MATLLCGMRRGAGAGTERVGGRAGWRGVLALVCAVLLASCQDRGPASGTALYVTTQFDPTLLLTQVRVWGSVESGPSFGPQLLPEQQDRVLHSGETLRILLGNVANGTTATVSVEGLRDRVVVARGTGTAQVRDGYEVDVNLRLEPTSPNPTGGDGGTTDPGDGFCAGCEGCCYNGRCTSPSFNTCGSGGIACVACDPARANACDPRGVCVCGTNPSCTGLNVDRCEGGQCKCGSSSPCGPGQECVDGTCRCTPNSCSGCCAGSTCEPGNTKDKCGKGGEACRKCNRTCNSDRTCG